ncbi:MAG: ankyrin repeat domain-containing protein, partial [Simkaniaceae bacterium]
MIEINSFVKKQKNRLIKILKDLKEDDLKRLEELVKKQPTPKFFGNLFTLAKFYNEIDFNLEYNDGNTPLHLAISRGDLEIVKALLDTKNIDVNFENNYGNTPLHHAISGGNLEIVKALLKIEEIDVDLENNDGETPLHCAV